MCSTVPPAPGARLASETALRLFAGTTMSVPAALPAEPSTAPFSVQRRTVTWASTDEAFARASTVVRPAVVEPAANQASLTGTVHAVAASPTASPAVTVSLWAPAIAPAPVSAAFAVSSRGADPDPPTLPWPSPVAVTFAVALVPATRAGRPSAVMAAAFAASAPMASTGPGQINRCWAEEGVATIT